MGNVLQSDFSTEIDFGKVIQFVENHMWITEFALGIADNIGYYAESEGWLRGNLSTAASVRAAADHIIILHMGNYMNLFIVYVKTEEIIRYKKHYMWVMGSNNILYGDK